MSFVISFVKTICVSGMLLMCLELLIPEGSQKNPVKLAIGIVFTVIMASPIIGLLIN